MTAEEELKLWRKLAVLCLGAGDTKAERALIEEVRTGVLRVHLDGGAFYELINSSPPSRVLTKRRRAVIVSHDRSGEVFARIARLPRE